MTDTNQAGQPAVRAPREEIRLAVVLNGGVSLAVWIGGVSLEIDRLTRREGAYDKLLRLVDASARVDVITGTSAGGINGAALGLAQLNKNADLRNLRSMWATEARMEGLLRTPFVGSPASLLKGDEYFLPALKRALSSLVVDYKMRSAAERPLSLHITTTLLKGTRRVSADSLGQDLVQDVHAGVLRFRHASDDEVDAFHPANIATTVNKLAVAARASASFPLAFEPAFVPVGKHHEDKLDFRDEADWCEHARPDDDPSRYGIDGGVLVNTPTLAALDAIEELSSRGAVRRIMLLVFPHAPGDTPTPAQTEPSPPTVVETFSSILGAMRSEADRTHVDKVEEHNRRAVERRAGRSDVLVSLLLEATREARRRTPDAPAQPAKVGKLLQQRYKVLFTHYRDLRVRRAARDFAARVPPRREWPHSRTVRAAEDAQTEFEQGRTGPEGHRRSPLPYVRDDARWGFSDDRSAWPWGVSTAEHMADDVLELIRHLERQDVDSEVIAGAREAIAGAKKTLRERREHFDDACRAAGLLDEARDRSFWLLWLDAYGHAFAGGGDLAYGRPDAPLADVRTALTDLLDGDLDSRSGKQVADAVATIGHATLKVRALLPLGAVQDRMSALDVRAPHSGQDAVITAWAALLIDADTAEKIVDLLLMIDVVTACLASGPEHGSEQVVELAQISLQTKNGFAVVTKEGADKLGGNRLGRFAGFLKESWRVNDWTWGRLDAATMLCRMVLEPDRVRRTLRTCETWNVKWPDANDRDAQTACAEEWVGGIVTTLFCGEEPRGFADLKQRAVEEARDHVFSESTSSSPPSLERLADIFAWSIQAQVALEELPALANAVTADDRDGAHRASRGNRFVEEHHDLLTDLTALSGSPRDATPTSAHVREGCRALEVFDHAGVGREPLGQESTGDLLIRTAVTAGAMGVTLLDSSRLGFSALKPVTRTLRGLALLPYWLARGLASASPLARSAASSVLAIGAAMLAVSLLVSSTPRWVAFVGLSTVLGAVGYSALRTGSLLHGLVLTTPVVPLTVYAVAIQADGSPSGGRTVLFVVALVLGVVALGSLPALTRTPAAWAADLVSDARAAPARPILVVVAVAAVLAAGIVTSADLVDLDAATRPAREAAHDLGEHLMWPGPWWLTGELTGTAVLMAVFYRRSLRSRQLRVYELLTPSTGTRQPHRFVRRRRVDARPVDTGALIAAASQGAARAAAEARKAWTDATQRATALNAARVAPTGRAARVAHRAARVAERTSRALSDAEAASVRASDAVTEWMRLRERTPPAPAAADSRSWRQVKVTDSSAVATGWAWVYAFVMLAAGWLLALSASRADFTPAATSPPSEKVAERALELALWSAVATCLLMWILLLGAVLVLPGRAQRSIESRLVLEARFGSFFVPDDPRGAEAQLRDRLITRGATYVFLVTPGRTTTAGPQLKLTRRGSNLADRLRRTVHHPADSIRSTPTR